MKSLAKNIFDTFGFRVHRKRQGMKWGNLVLVKDLDVIIDVGVAYGTPHLYNRYKNAYKILVEPFEFFNPYLEAWIKTSGGEIHNVAIGEKNSLLEMSFRGDHPEQSGAFTRTFSTPTKHNIKTVQIPVKPLDEICRTDILEKKSVLLKVDTQGNEIKALLGAKKTLSMCNYVIVHMTSGPRFEDNYEPWQVNDIMQESGYRLKSVLNAGIGLDYMCRFADFLYEKP